MIKGSENRKQFMGVLSIFSKPLGEGNYLTKRK